MQMVQQSVSINGRAVVILATGKLYRVETKARQQARYAGRGAKGVTHSFHVVEASCCREAIANADDPKVKKVIDAELENYDD